MDVRGSKKVTINNTTIKNYKGQENGPKVLIFKYRSDSQDIKKVIIHLSFSSSWPRERGRRVLGVPLLPADLHYTLMNW